MSNLSLIVKKSIAPSLHLFMRAKTSFCNNKGILILMFHRIIKNKSPDSLMQSAMYVNTSTFENQIIFLKKYYEIIQLEQCWNIIKGSEIRGGNKPLCCITFDDGWKDFYCNAFNVLNKYDVNATVFLPTGYIGTNNKLWTEKLAIIVSAMKHGGDTLKCNQSVDPIVKEIEALNGSELIRYEKAIEILKKLKLENIDYILKVLTERCRIDLSNRDRLFLTWEEVKEMHRSGYIQYGSHTRNHQILTTISEDMILEELIQSRDRLINEGVVSESFIPFAYPNGNHTDHIAKLVQKAGYGLAVTTNKGWNRLTENELDIYKLKRVGIHQDIASTSSMFSCRIHGIY